MGASVVFIVFICSEFSFRILINMPEDINIPIRQNKFNVVTKPDATFVRIRELVGSTNTEQKPVVMTEKLSHIGKVTAAAQEEQVPNMHPEHLAAKLVFLRTVSIGLVTIFNLCKDDSSIALGDET